jgi:hypothetical protein
MALCDRLESSLAATAASRRRLLDALLAEALTPAEDRKLEAAECLSQPKRSSDLDGKLPFTVQARRPPGRQHRDAGRIYGNGTATQH